MSAPPNFEGTVSALEKRSEQDEPLLAGQNQGPRTLQVWTFRVIRRDANGYEIPPPIPVEMAGHSFYGSTLQNGDLVRVPEPWQAGKTVHTNEIYNLTTASPIRAADKDKSYGSRMVRFVAGLFFSTVAFFMLRLGSSMPGASGAPPSEQASISTFSTLWTIFCLCFLVVGLFIALSGLFGFSFKGRR